MVTFVYIYKLITSALCIGQDKTTNYYEKDEEI